MGGGQNTRPRAVHRQDCGWPCTVLLRGYAVDAIDSSADTDMGLPVRSACTPDQTLLHHNRIGTDWKLVHSFFQHATHCPTPPHMPACPRAPYAAATARSAAFASLFRRRFCASMKTSSALMSAGFTPPMRAACPMLAGRILPSFSDASADSEGTTE